MDIKEKIAQANEKTVHMLMDSDPVWVDMKPAIECVDGLEDHMILHSGPPIAYEDMTMLHKRGMVSAMLFEGWAKDEEEAVKRLKAGEIKISSALDHNTVGAGTGIITKSVVLNVVEDRHNHTVAATFPAEGPFQGGFCGWGLYSKEIAENLRYMREELFPPMVEALHKLGGIPIKPILAESMQMGDENHTRQTACDYIYDRLMLPALFELDRPKKEIMKTVRYIVDTPRFFHCYGQAAARAALVAADGTEYSTMVTAVCGNGVEFGIKIASLPGQWFTAPAPMMKGRYTSSEFTEKDQLPWMGDSCVVECYGMGGFTGTILIGILASKTINGVAAGWHQFMVQVGGVILVAVYAFVITWIIVKVLAMITDIKPTKEQVEEGLDKVLLDEATYDLNSLKGGEK